MVIIRDNQGNIIGKEASASYVPTRKLRAAHEQKLCDAQMGIVREKPVKQDKLVQTNIRRVNAGLEPVYNDAGYRCACEDYPACGH